MKSFYPKKRTFGIPSLYGVMFNFGGEAKHRFPSLFLKPYCSIKPLKFAPSPSASVKLQYEPGCVLKHELELGVLVNRPGRDIDPKKFLDYVEGGLLVFDVTRSFESPGVQVGNRKMGQNFTPISPLIPKEILEDLGSLELKMSDKKKQVGGKLADLHFSLPEIMKYISSTSGLVPGDIIMSGTHGDLISSKKEKITGSLLKDGKEIYSASFKVSEGDASAPKTPRKKKADQPN